VKIERNGLANFQNCMTTTWDDPISEYKKHNIVDISTEEFRNRWTNKVEIEIEFEENSPDEKLCDVVSIFVDRSM
jgi:hypothetical protein